MSKVIELTYKDTPFEAYLAEPKVKTKGGIIVIHEVWGLNDHTKTIAERFAAEGYLALAPSLLFETDIAKHADKLALDLFNPETRNETQPKLRALMAPMQEPGFAPTALGRLEACFGYLLGDERTGGKVAVCGFCFGGSYSFSLATHEPRLKAAVPFYGHADMEHPETFAQINCPILAFYGDQDQNLMASLPALKGQMQKAHVNFEAKVYSGAGHAFFNDTNPYAYNEQAAQDSWRLTLDFLAQHVV